MRSLFDVKYLLQTISSLESEADTKHKNASASKPMKKETSNDSGKKGPKILWISSDEDEGGHTSGESESDDGE